MIYIEFTRYCNSTLTILAKSSYHEVDFHRYQHSFVKQRFDTLYVATVGQVFSFIHSPLSRLGLLLLLCWGFSWKRQGVAGGVGVVVTIPCCDDSREGRKVTSFVLKYFQCKAAVGRTFSNLFIASLHRFGMSRVCCILAAGPFL